MKNIKSNRGVSITDVVIALIILTIFTGVIGNLIYQIAYNNAALRVNASRLCSKRIWIYR